MTTRRVKTAEAGKGPFKVQWDFTDAAPWNVVVNNGSTRAEQGSIPDPDLTLKTSWPDWVGIALNDRNPLRAIAERRLTPKGSPRASTRSGKFFPRSEQDRNPWRAGRLLGQSACQGGKHGRGLTEAGGGGGAPGFATCHLNAASGRGS